MYNTTIPWDFKSKHQNCEGNLELHSEKGYLDYLSSEFKRVPIEDKALTLARLIYFGLDLPNYVKGYKERKSYHTTSTLSDTLLCYIQTLRWGEALHDTTNFMLDNMDDNDLAILLQEELKVRYTIWEGIGEDRLIFSRWRDDMLNDMAILARKDRAKFTNILVTADFSREYKEEVRVPKENFNLKNDKTMTREDVIAQNPWVEVAAKIQKCIDTKNWYYEGGFICEADRSIIEAHNEKCDNSTSPNKTKCKYLIEPTPYVYSGNILNAKVVILSLNPGYSEDIQKTQFDNMSDAEKIVYYQSVINDLNFRAERMIEIKVEENESNKYWTDKLSSLWKKGNKAIENINKDTVMKNFALLQSVGYRSIENAEFKDLGRFPSSRFVYKIIDYLATQSDCLFIILRRNYFWEYLLDIKDVQSDRIIRLNSPRATTISRGNMSEEDFEKISNALKE